MAEDGSNTSPSQQPPLHIHRPIPRRTFDTSAYQDSADSPTHAFSQATPPSANENRRSSDFLAQLNARLLRTFRDEESEEQEGPPPRNKSFLNMTSSTLSGIYDEIGSATAGERSTMETPWGTGAETPAHSGMGMPAWETGHGSPDGGISMKNQLRRRSSNYKPQGKNKSHPSKAARQGPLKYAVIASKLAALYVFGIIYGLIVSQLHETRHLAPMRMEGVNRNNGVYLASWGAFGVALGSLLPYVDLIWDGQRSKDDTEEDDRPESSPISEQINDIVRSVCAFIGIAFAIRRLPWQSTLQLTLTLALVNPALWYILDRSRPGLSLSLIVTSVATSFIFLHNPDALPSPPLPATTNVTRLHSSGRDRIHAGNPSSASSQNPELFAGMVSYENLAVVTWVGSVLFCSCVCFGSIGRRLGVLDGSSSASKR